MSHDARLIVKNRTGCRLINGSIHIDDGSMDPKFPKTIEAGADAKATGHASTLHGPEGMATWQVDTGIERLPVKVTWDHPRDAHVSTYGVVHDDPRLGRSSARMTDDGDNQTAEYELHYDVTAPGDWDMQLFLSEGLINTQAQQTMTLFKTFSIEADGARLEINAATVAVSLPATSGDPLVVQIAPGRGSTLQVGSTSLDLFRRTLDIPAPITAARLPTDDPLPGATDAARSQLQAQRRGGSILWGIGVELAHRAGAPTIREADSTVVPLSGAQIAGLGACLDAHAAAQPPPTLCYVAQAQGARASLEPTVFEQVTSAGAGQKALGLLMMTRGRARPRVNSRYHYDARLDALAPGQGCLFFSVPALDLGFVNPVVIPRVRDAFRQASDDYAAKMAHLETSCVRTTDRRWHVEVRRDNSDLHGGKGEKEARDGQIDLFTTRALLIEADLRLTRDGTQVQVQGDGSFSLTEKVHKYIAGISDLQAEAAVSQRFTLTLTLEADTLSGDLLVASQLTPIDAPKVTKDQDSLDALVDSVVGAITGIFYGEQATATEQLDDDLAGLAASLMASLDAGVGDKMEVAGHTVVLPRAERMSYSDLGVDPQAGLAGAVAATVAIITQGDTP